MDNQTTTLLKEPGAGRSISSVKKVFISPNGLRAGWRILIFLLIFVGMLRGFLRILHQSGRGNQTALTPIDVAISAGTGFLLCSIATWIMSKIEGRKMGQYGLPWAQAFRKDLWVGLLWGFLTTSGTVLVISLFHGVQITNGAEHGGKLLAWAAAWAGGFLLVGFNEEFGFRGYLQFTLTTGIGFWPAAVVISGLFGLAHAGNSGENLFGEVAVVLFGLLFCLIIKRRGNLWWAVGFHMGYDWAETFFWGEPDSGLSPTHNFLTASFHGPKWLTGGSVGPEASVVTPIALLLVAILFSMVYRENLYRTNMPVPLRRGEAESPASA